MAHSDNECVGFSRRFNRYLDDLGYPSMEDGRVALLSEELAMSKSGLRKWLVMDNAPKVSKLIYYTEQLLNSALDSNRLAKKHKNINPKKIACWLEYGEECIMYPLLDFTQFTSDYEAHEQIGKVYLLVDKVAKTLKVDIHALPAKQLDELYAQVIGNMESEKLLEPDKELVRSLLYQASKNSLS